MPADTSSPIERLTRRLELRELTQAARDRQWDLLARRVHELEQRAGITREDDDQEDPC